MAQPHLQRVEQGVTAAQPSRLIGELLAEALQLTDCQVSAILEHQNSTGLRFGESAVALRLAETADVLQALSRQYRFPVPEPGTQPGHGELAMMADPFGAQADVFRDLRGALLAERTAAETKTALAVVSAEAGEGKSYVAANLAVAFSQLGARTLLVDADMRAPRQHEILGIDAAVGLSGVLAGLCGRNAVQPLAQLPALHVLPAGPLPPNPLELLHGAAFDRLMADMLCSFDHVVVDTPAATRGADARVLAAKCGAALVVARKHRSRMVGVQALLDALAKARVTVGGVLINEH